MDARLAEKVFQIERQIESMGGSLSPAERHKAATLMAAWPRRYFHDGQVDVNLAAADANRIDSEGGYFFVKGSPDPSMRGGAEDRRTLREALREATTRRGTGATVRETLDATIQKLRGGFYGSGR